MAMQLGFDLIKEAIIDTSIFGLGWLLPLAGMGLSLWLITRDMEKWKILAFPMLTGWYLAGLRSGTFFDSIILITSAAIFTIEAMSIQSLERLATTVRIKTREIITRITEEERELAKTVGRQVKEQNILKRFEPRAHERRLKSLQRDIKLSLGKRGTRETLLESRKTKEIEKIEKAKKEKEKQEDRNLATLERLRRLRIHQKQEKKSQILKEFGEATYKGLISTGLTPKQARTETARRLKAKREEIEITT